MTAIVWTTLITAVATVTASLGAVWIKSSYDDRAQARQAEQTAAESATGRQREAYAGLVQTARFVHGVGLRIREEFEGLPADDIDHIADLAAPLVHDLTQAVALVELTGSVNARSYALDIYDKAMVVGHSFAQRVRILAAAHNNSEMLVPEFNKSAATAKLHALNKAIQSFADCVRPELDGTLASSAQSPPAAPEARRPSTQYSPE
jgi:hypothetical protein